MMRSIIEIIITALLLPLAWLVQRVVDNLESVAGMEAERER